MDDESFTNAHESIKAGRIETQRAQRNSKREKRIFASSLCALCALWFNPLQLLFVYSWKFALIRVDSCSAFTPDVQYAFSMLPVTSSSSSRSAESRPLPPKRWSISPSREYIRSSPCWP